MSQHDAGIALRETAGRGCPDVDADGWPYVCVPTTQVRTFSFGTGAGRSRRPVSSPGLAAAAPNAAGMAPIRRLRATAARPGVTNTNSVPACFVVWLARLHDVTSPRAWT